MKLKETIKNEIQRRMENCQNEEVTLAYSGLIEFIDNLPEEPSFIEERDQKIKVMLSKLTDEEKALLLSMQGGSFGGFGPSLLSLVFAAGLNNIKKEEGKDE